MDQKRAACPNPDTNRKRPKTSPASSTGGCDQNSDLTQMLPTEIWITIFEYLSSSELLTLRKICRRWRNIVNDSHSLLAKLTVTFKGRLTICSAYQPDSLPPASKVHFKSVTINGIGSWWTKFGQDLTEIRMSSCSTVDFASWLVMLESTPKLKSFELNESELIDEQWRSSEEVDFRLDKLEKLVLRGVEDDTTVELFRQLCPGLKSLRVTWDWFPEEQFVSPHEMATLLGGLQSTLQELHITCTADTLEEVMKLDGLKLRKLTLEIYGGNDGDRDRNLIELFRMNASLEYLKIKGMVAFDETNHSLLCNIGQQLPNLNFLLINAVHVDLAFLYSFPKVQTLRLVGPDFYATVILFNGEEHLNLTELQLKKIHFEDSCLQQHFPKMPYLRSLTINWCMFRSWQNLLEAIKSLKMLQNLTLNEVRVVESTDCTLDDFTLAVHQLHLSQCEMAPKLLAALLSRCPDLRELRLQPRSSSSSSSGTTVHHAGLGMKVVHVLCSRNLSKLNTLILHGCEVSAKEANYIRKNCHSLKQLQITESWYKKFGL